MSTEKTGTITLLSNDGAIIPVGTFFTLDLVAASREQVMLTALRPPGG
jgi:hypothetical protein